MTAPRKAAKGTARARIKDPSARTDPKGGVYPKKRVARYIGETESNLKRGL
jgi:hypothetical protein